MTGPQHYRQAQQLIATGKLDATEPQLVLLTVAVAQVHATLALAEAYVAGAVMRPEDRDEWDQATGRSGVTR